MIEGLVPDSPGYLVLGAVRGLAADAERIGPLLDRFAPRAVGLSTSADELTGIDEHFGASPTEPLVPLAPGESAEVRGLAHYGEVRVPNPSFSAALAWGRARSVPVEGVDPSDDAYAEMFADRIGYPDLLRRTLAERRLVRHPPRPPTPDEFALEWAAPVNRGSGSVRLLNDKNAVLVENATKLARRAGRIALVVDRERFDGVLYALRGRSVGSL